MLRSHCEASSLTGPAVGNCMCVYGAGMACVRMCLCVCVCEYYSLTTYTTHSCVPWPLFLFLASREPASLVSDPLLVFFF
ncbi:uncharacterized protein B0I36DRAFT_315552 [Microdochium trichocladiopsis]